MSLLKDVFVPVETVLTEADCKPRVKQLVDSDLAKRHCRTNPQDIDNELITLPSLFAYWSEIVVKARLQRDGFKSRLSLVEARLDRAIRQKVSASGGRKPSEAKIAATIKANEHYVGAEIALSEAEAVLSAAFAVQNAITMKRDMLVQINKNLQREWDYQTTLRRTGEESAEEVQEKIKNLSRSRPPLA